MDEMATRTASNTRGLGLVELPEFTNSPAICGIFAAESRKLADTRERLALSQSGVN
jgi:hypothetical protein